MPKFVKKPVEVDAVVFDGNIKTVIDFMESSDSDGRFEMRDGGLYIKTLEGEHLASVGDYIIRGVKGEYYPCKPDIFAMTYDRVAA